MSNYEEEIKFLKRKIKELKEAEHRMLSALVAEEQDVIDVHNVTHHQITTTLLQVINIMLATQKRLEELNDNK